MVPPKGFLGVILLIILVKTQKSFGMDWISPPPSGPTAKDLTENGLHSQGNSAKLDNNSKDTAYDARKSEILKPRPRRSNLKRFEMDPTVLTLTPQQREYYLKLMSMLSKPKEGNGHQSYRDRMGATEADTDFVDDDDESEPIDLGYYGSNPYPYKASPYVKVVDTDDDDSVDIMRSRPPLDAIYQKGDRYSNRNIRNPGYGVSHFRYGHSKKDFSPFQKHHFIPRLQYN